MVDPSCQIQEASVAVKYAKQQKYSTFHNFDEDMSGVLQLKLHNPSTKCTFFHRCFAHRLGLSPVVLVTKQRPAITENTD